MNESVTLFWFGAVALIVLALLFVCLPLVHFRRNPPADDIQNIEQVNLNVRREQLADLKSRYESGQYSQEEFENHKAELEQNLLDDLDGLKDQGQQSPKTSGLAIPLVLAAFIPVLAIGLYYKLGATDQLEQTAAINALASAHSSAEGMSAMESIVERWPNDYRTRFELAGFYMSSGRYAEAAEHYGIIVKQTGGQQGEPLAQQAQALYLSNDNQMNPLIEGLIKQALRMAPENTTALGLEGIAAFESGDYKTVVRAWKTLLALTSDPTARQALKAGIARAQQELGIEPEGEAAVEPNKSLKVRVSLDKTVEQIPASARVFVYARSVDSPMPLVIMPLTMADLPGTFELANAEPMIAGVTLTEHQKVDVVVRISLTGNVMKPDYEGVTKSIEVGAGEQANVIVLPKDV
ncbi:c-type cytochrome biogenesis protein CcmI [Sansalvadorimonas verongulae]|uniref:c-type cytochrome biogenesis protein CcmI n=1 Tax=Sansalvadorimonas verongulae TaxID=2172824 RepID=UPI0012BB89E6|nr:c-type cytochrome biogenesis protein CcmI [Sansalvadorimonas verongulae]MTI13784.1 c-type cytochrome biogenesis protein CcmI [Sansalvadorimonas verongulae]